MTARAHKLRRGPRLGVVALIAMLTSACDAELYNNLDQRQANEMVAALLGSGIPAARQTGKNGRAVIMVDQARFAEALRVLDQHGLPKQDFSNLGEIFKKDGLVSSPVQERAQMIFALSQELSRTVSEIDGVLSARVHLVLPENEPLQQRLVPSSASVFIRHQANVAMSGLIPQIKMLVANGIAGLSYDKVSVVLVPVDQPARAERSEARLSSVFGLWMHRDSAARATWLIGALVVAIVGLIGAVGWLLARPGQQMFRLTDMPSGRKP
jgi:type III secretion protein J